MIVKYENDVMNDEELDAVAGGTDAESESLFNALKKRALLKNMLNTSKVRECTQW
ncbi:MAG: hypothetical protein IJS29_08320 [Selenomonadaceae bacterium]|nr:hypothetical protein [Selenomonadaceae bacterium]